MELAVVILWVMSAIGLLVVAPLVVMLAAYVIQPALQCARYADDILEHGVGITVALEPVPALVTTREVAGEVTDNAVAYVGALRRLVAQS
jgi:hypothetical protein